MAVKVKSKSEIKKVEIKYQLEKNGKKKSYKRKNCSYNAKESPFKPITAEMNKSRNPSIHIAKLPISYC